MISTPCLPAATSGDAFLVDALYVRSMNLNLNSAERGVCVCVCVYVRAQWRRADVFTIYCNHCEALTV